MQLLFTPVRNILFKLQMGLEKQAFGVCTALSDITGISTASVRFFFIYLSFLTFGSPVIIYMGLAFLMNFAKHYRRRRSIWDC